MNKLFYLFIFITLWACTNKDVTSSLPEEEQLNNFVSNNKYTLTEKTSSGLRYIRLQEGTGTVLKAGQTVEIKYNGIFLTKKSFDSGTFSYKLGTSGVIAGFEEGLLKMKVGEKAVIAMPSAIGYGARGSGAIPANTPLAFELEILSAK